MITRIWHGKTKASHAESYLKYLQATGLKDYVATPGIISAKVLRKIDGDICHFYTVTEWDSITRIMGKFHDRYDLYLTPTLAVPPVRIGELDPTPIESLCLKIINTSRLGKLLTTTGLSDKLALNSLSKSPFTASGMILE